MPLCMETEILIPDNVDTLYSSNNLNKINTGYHLKYIDVCTYIVKHEEKHGYTKHIASTN